MTPRDEMPEKEWQRQIVQLAEQLGWRAMHVYPLRSKTGPKTPTTVAGWPDLFLWNPRRPERGFVAIEVKSEQGKATKEQMDVLVELQAAGARVMLARPRDLDDVAALLGQTATATR